MGEGSVLRARVCAMCDNTMLAAGPPKWLLESVLAGGGGDFRRGDVWMRGGERGLAPAIIQALVGVNCEGHGLQSTARDSGRYGGGSWMRKGRAI